MCTNVHRKSKKPLGRSWKIMEVSGCQPLPAWISKILKDLQDGDGRSSRALSRETSMGQFGSHKAKHQWPTVSNTSEHIKNTSKRCRRAQGIPERAQGGPEEGPGRTPSEGPGKTQGGGPGQGPERAQARRGAQSGRGQGGIKPTSHLAPQTSDDAKQQSLNQSKDQVQLKCSS